MNSLPKIVSRQRRGCDLNPGPSAPDVGKEGNAIGPVRPFLRLFSL